MRIGTVVNALRCNCVITIGVIIETDDRSCIIKRKDGERFTVPLIVCNKANKEETEFFFRDAKGFRSCAKWPSGTTCDAEGITTDDHGSMKQAQAICSLLHQNGFGGNRKVFPIATWVEPIMK